MVNRDDEDGVIFVVDAVDDAVVAAPGRVVLCEVEIQFPSYPLGILGKAAVDEFHGCGRDLLRQAAEVALG